jgi:hypothetical protein
MEGVVAWIRGWVSPSAADREVAYIPADGGDGAPSVDLEAVDLVAVALHRRI